MKRFEIKQKVYLIAERHNLFLFTEYVFDMVLKGIEAVIFDLGGTLQRPALDLLEKTSQYLADCGITEYSRSEIEEAIRKGRDEWLHQYMMKNNVGPRWQPSREVWVEHDRFMLESLGVKENLDQLAEAYQEKWDIYLRDFTYSSISVCIPVLEELQARAYKLAIASNRVDNPIPSLEADGILGLFGSIEYTMVPGYVKPSPYMLLKVSSELGVNPKRCAYVGNIVQFDVVAAQRAEMTPILLTWCDPEEIDKAPKDTIMIGHIKELLDILQ
ncbi:MAG: HAD family hydrolase [Candidatus Thorarchaeota archaeon]